MGKTLYLNENKDLSIRCDGPSLWIVQKGKAGVRVPARRVDRVVIAGNVQFDTNMLILFTERGVPITFLNRKGEPTATAMGINPPDWTVRERQYLLGMTREGRMRGENWMRSGKRERQLSLLKKFVPATAKLFMRKGFRQEDHDKVVRMLCPYESKAVAVVRALISGLIHETVLKVVYDTGLDVHCGILSRREEFGLIKDLCSILEPEENRQVIQFFRSMERERDLSACPAQAGKNRMSKKGALLYKKGGNWKISREGRRDIIARFENRRAELIIMIEALVEDLIRMTRESVYEDKISCVL